MIEIRPAEKFIGFVDILGYSALTRVAEAGRGLSLSELQNIIKLLGSSEDRDRYEKRGGATCPGAPHIRKDLDFQISQAWDSVVVSTEISPAGAINLVSHCWGACIMLLTKGVMCRGYIKRGMVYHEGEEVLGSGHVDAVAKEKLVSIFKRDAQEKGTPFIQVDNEVVEYIAGQSDKCVKEMFSRMIVTDGDVTALFPIKRLSHKFILAGYGTPPLDAEKEKSNNDMVRRNIMRLKDKILCFVDASDSSAVQKSEHYIRALDAQLIVCDETDALIDGWEKRFGTKVTSDKRPGLFR